MLALDDPKHPDLILGPLKVWVRGYQYPGVDDFWDGNWLFSSACCEVGQSRVWIEGPFLRVDELLRWKDQCKELSSRLEGTAALTTLEEQLEVRMQERSLGHIDLEIDITPNHLNEVHQFRIEIDQSYLSDLIGYLHQILARFPMKSAEGLKN